MNELEITRYLIGDRATKKYFRGVMAYDKLPSSEVPYGLYVVNTDLSTGPGIHWICIMMGDICEYFDPLGNPPDVLRNFLEKQGKTWIYSNQRIQGIGSDVCGDYCVLFAYYRCRGFSMEEYVKLFTLDYMWNDSLVKL